MNDPGSISWLELKVPPALVTLLFAAAIWGVTTITPAAALPHYVRVIELALVLASAIFGIGALISFRKARTTIHPMTPEESRSLVVSGVFRVSRNPMYLALLLLLLALALQLSSPAGFLLAWLFIPYMNRFQILPEERAMEKLFGRQFEQYRSKVRRWI
jgi:protein-S-isoprenylcysteine O-methyltransferase Ste14